MLGPSQPLQRLENCSYSTAALGAALTQPSRSAFVERIVKILKFHALTFRPAPSFRKVLIPATLIAYAAYLVSNNSMRKLGFCSNLPGIQSVCYVFQENRKPFGYSKPSFEVSLFEVTILAK